MFESVGKNALRLLSRHKNRRRCELATGNRERYERALCGGESPSQIQLRRMNMVWASMSSSVPYYNRLVCRKELPERFESWEEFLATVPVADRNFVREHQDELTDQRKKADFRRVTGGSTSEPVNLPGWRSELEETEANEWLARSWIGISPIDSSFRIWGHSHLLGRGLRYYQNRVARKLKDAALGIYRFSAYDLSDEALERAVRIYNGGHFVYVLGYSNALLQWARLILERKLSIARSPRAVIATAEGFPSAQCASLVKRVFDCPLIMEYGSVETNMIAQEDQFGGYRVLWMSYFVEALEGGEGGGCRVRVTSLYPRAFPLMRYDLGDEIRLSEPGFGVTRFDAVIGRCNETIVLPSGDVVHSEAVAHCVRDIPSVRAFQFVNENGRHFLNLKSEGGISSGERKEILSRLSKVNRQLGGTEIREVDRLVQTRAGKTPMIVNSVSDVS